MTRVPRTVRIKIPFRTQNIRLDFLARRLLESVFLFWLIIAFVQQWIMPHLQETEERKHKSQVFTWSNQIHAFLLTLIL